MARHHRITIDTDPTQLKPRACLKCDKPFMSAGPHNRLCPTCNGHLSGEATPEETHRMPGGRR